MTRKSRRTSQLSLSASCRSHFLAACEPQRLLRSEPRAEPERIDRVVRVQMGVAPIGTLGKIGQLDRALAVAGFRRVDRFFAAARTQQDRTKAERSQRHTCPRAMSCAWLSPRKWNFQCALRGCTASSRLAALEAVFQRHNLERVSETSAAAQARSNCSRTARASARLPCSSRLCCSPNSDQPLF